MFTSRHGQHSVLVQPQDTGASRLNTIFASTAQLLATAVAHQPEAQRAALAAGALVAIARPLAALTQDGVPTGGAPSPESPRL
jgi:hypothetical protein